MKFFSTSRLLAVVLFTTASIRAESLPFMRPALLGHHKQSLVNLIDTAALVKRGQGDAIVLFSASISPVGDAYGGHVYRCSPTSELLQREVLARLKMAQFEPAVYRHSRQWVYLTGTIMLRVADGKGQLRIFLHQEDDELRRGSDFIAPQFLYTLAGTKFKNIYWPPNAPGHEGIASVALNVDENGKVQAVKLTYEHPPGLGFGAATAGPLRDADFVPAHRDGKPVSCRFNLPIIFFGPGAQMRTG
jgi:hypothetical protein